MKIFFNKCNFSIHLIRYENAMFIIQYTNYEIIMIIILIIFYNYENRNVIGVLRLSK